MTTLFISKYPPVFWSPLTCVCVWALQTLMLSVCMNNLFVTPHPQGHSVQGRMTLHTLQPGGGMVRTPVALETQAGGVCHTHWSYVNDMGVASGGERVSYNDEWRALGGGNVQKGSRCSYVKWVRWLITVACKRSLPLFTPNVSGLAVNFNYNHRGLFEWCSYCSCNIAYVNDCV